MNPKISPQIGPKDIKISILKSTIIANEMNSAARNVGDTTDVAKDDTTNLLANKDCDKQYRLINNALVSYSEKIAEDINAFRSVAKLFSDLDTELSNQYGK